MIKIPQYKYLGCGEIQTKTSAAGAIRQYRCIYVVPVKDDGSTTSSTNLYLSGSALAKFDPSKVQLGESVFLDFNHKGFLVDLRQLKKVE